MNKDKRRTFYQSCYMEIGQDLKKFVNDKKKELKKRGRKFNYGQCFRALQKKLGDKPIKQMADEKHSYKSKIIRDWVIRYMRRLDNGEL